MVSASFTASNIALGYLGQRYDSELRPLGVIEPIPQLRHQRQSAVAEQPAHGDMDAFGVGPLLLLQRLLQQSHHSAPNDVIVIAEQLVDSLLRPPPQCVEVDLRCPPPTFARSTLVSYFYGHALYCSIFSALSLNRASCSWDVPRIISPTLSNYIM